MLNRVRVAVGLVGVAVGAMWAVGGLSTVGEGTLALVKALPAASVTAGLVLLLRAVAPRGVLAGPLVLIALGSVALAVEFGMLRMRELGYAVPALLVAGGVVIAMTGRVPEPALPVIVQRCWSVFGQATPVVRGPVPYKFVVRCLLGSLVLDLSGADYRQEVDELTVDVTLIGGRVELVLPAEWSIRAGRLALARAIKFDGQMNASTNSAADIPNLVVLNVQGWSGALIVKRHPA